MKSLKTLYTASLLTLTVVVFAVAGFAQADRNELTSDLLLPYFEVDLGGSSLTTLFSVTNALDQPVDISITVYTNWGIEVSRIAYRLERHQVLPLNLRDWISGHLPNGDRLGIDERAHLQATLTGTRSPTTDLFYSSETKTDLAVGYVVIRTTGNPRPQALWGDFFIVDPSNDFAQGDLLVNVNPTITCRGVCDRHAMRYLVGGAFTGGTELVVWTPASSSPRPVAVYPEENMVHAASAFYDEGGLHVADRAVDLMAVQVLNLEELGFVDAFGWLDLRSTEGTFIGVRYSAENRFSVGLQTTCLPVVQADEPRIRLEKLTNGEDADIAPGPEIATGSPVTWEYVVSNSGQLRIEDIVVADDQGVEVTCPGDSLEPGEQMVCTGSGTAESCQYRNLGLVQGRATDNQLVADDDPSHYFGSPGETELSLETAVNGNPANAPDGPEVAAGSTLQWTFLVTNTGELDLIDVAVSDDLGTAIACPGDTLAAGASMTCRSTSTARAGKHKNVGRATGRPDVACGAEASADDPAHYHTESEPLVPRIDIEKATNGHDADFAPGPTLTVGDPVTWTYRVTNTGELALSNVTVTDDQGVAVSCPKSNLAIGESMTCTGHGTATEGQYANLGTATGDSSEGPVDDSDPSHYFGKRPLVPRIDIEKATNGHDADFAPGPTLTVGDPVTWTYRVTNTGELALSNVTVTDDQGVAVSCPKSNLAIGESMTCTGHGFATEGQYANLGTATGDSSEGPVDDSDPSHYFGERPGGQGCTPGYWKNHLDSWPPTGYSPAQSVQSVFSQAAAYPAIGSASLAQALDFGGGSDVEGAMRNLMRAAVASLLNASHPGVSFPRSPGQVISEVNAALASGDRDTALALAAALDRDNNGGCPLN